MIAKFGVVAIQGQGVLRTRTWGRGFVLVLVDPTGLDRIRTARLLLKKLDLVIVFIYVTHVNLTFNMTQIQT